MDVFSSLSTEVKLNKLMTELLILHDETANGHAGSVAYRTAFDRIQESSRTERPRTQRDIDNFTFVIPQYSLAQVKTLPNYTNMREGTHFKRENNIMYYNTNLPSLAYTHPETAGHNARTRLATDNPAATQQQLETVQRNAIDTAYQQNIAASLLPKEWVQLQRTEQNDVRQEDSLLQFSDPKHKVVNWHKTIRNIKEMGEDLGYSMKHYERVMNRFVAFYNPELSPLLESINVVNFCKMLMSTTTPTPPKEMLQTTIKSTTRSVGENLRSTMGRLGTAVAAYYEGTEHAAAQLNRFLLLGLTSFTAGENRKHLMNAINQAQIDEKPLEYQVLLEACIKGERIHGIPTTELRLGHPSDTVNFFSSVHSPIEPVIDTSIEPVMYSLDPFGTPSRKYKEHTTSSSTYDSDDPSRGPRVRPHTFGRVRPVRAPRPPERNQNSPSPARNEQTPPPAEAPETPPRGAVGGEHDTTPEQSDLEERNPNLRSSERLRLRGTPTTPTDPFAAISTPFRTSGIMNRTPPGKLLEFIKSPKGKRRANKPDKLMYGQNFEQKSSRQQSRSPSSASSRYSSAEQNTPKTSKKSGKSARKSKKDKSKSSDEDNSQKRSASSFYTTVKSVPRPEPRTSRNSRRDSRDSSSDRYKHRNRSTDKKDGQQKQTYRSNSRERKTDNRKRDGRRSYTPENKDKSNPVIIGVNCNPQFSKQKEKFCRKCISESHFEPDCPTYFHWAPRKCDNCRAGYHFSNQCKEKVSDSKPRSSEPYKSNYRNSNYSNQRSDRRSQSPYNRQNTENRNKPYPRDGYRSSSPYNSRPQYRPNSPYRRSQERSQNYRQNSPRRFSSSNDRSSNRREYSPGNDRRSYSPNSQSRSRNYSRNDRRSSSPSNNRDGYRSNYRSDSKNLPAQARN
jgi:hypothetical protein